MGSIVRNNGSPFHSCNSDGIRRGRPGANGVQRATCPDETIQADGVKRRLQNRICSAVEQVCRVQHRKFPVRISRQEAKKVCNVPGELPTLAPAPSPGLTPVLPSSPSVVPTFTAPASVPNSPALNQQPDLTSQPLDQQRGLAPGPVDQQLGQQPGQGGLSTLDEILAARKAKTSKNGPRSKLSEKLVFSS